jgi:hypothetical protein
MTASLLWPAGAIAQTPQPVVWGEEAFVIPYQWSSAADPARTRAVELYASTDRGRTWQKISEAQPSVRYFTYRAPQDGEYSFAIRTIDTAGNAWPAEPMRPELQVVVDTTGPQILTLAGSVAPDGQVTANWQTYDAHLDPQSWVLRYRTSQMNDWQTVTPGGPVQSSSTQQFGQTTWSVPPGTQQVWLQAQIRDLAGNTRELGAVAQTNPGTPGPYVAGTPQAPAGAPLAPAASSGPAFPSFAAGAPPLSFASQPTRPSGGSQLAPQGSLAGASPDPFAAATATSLPLLPPLAPSTAAAPWATQPAGDTARGTPANSPWPTDTTATTPYGNVASAPVVPSFGSATSGDWAAAPGEAPLAPGGASPTNVNRFASLPQGNPPQLAAPSVPGFAGAADQYVNDLEFEIDYQVDRDGTFGVSRVELWATRDGGRSWRRLAVDAETAGGLEPQTPRPGDRPELMLRVDTERPQAQLLEVVQGENYFADHLIINWQASDADLSLTPISLHYSSRANGPWIPLATGLSNSGRYSWRLQRHLPSQVYIKLEATDRAGNIASSVTPRPIAIELPIPTGQLQGVRGAGQ